MNFPPEVPEVVERAFWDLADLTKRRPHAPTEKELARWTAANLHAWLDEYRAWDKTVEDLAKRIRGMMV